jgi:hypothetical protein
MCHAIFQFFIPIICVCFGPDTKLLNHYIQMKVLWHNIMQQISIHGWHPNFVHFLLQHGQRRAIFDVAMM